MSPAGPQSSPPLPSPEGPAPTPSEAAAGGRKALLFAGVVAEGTAAGAGPIAREEAYRATWARGEAIAGRSLSLGAPSKESEASDMAATLHGCAAFAALEARGLAGADDLVAAHSLGLYAALFAAGAVSLEGALLLAAEAARGLVQAGRERPSGLAAIVGLPLERIDALVASHACAVANRNSGHQAVVGGETARLGWLLEAARAAGALDVRRIDAPCAVHTSFAEGAAAHIAALLESGRVAIAEPRRAVCTGLPGERWVRTAEEARLALARNLASTIDWPAAVAALRAEGAARLVDLGPGDALGRLARFIDRDLASIALDGARDAKAARAFLESAAVKAGALA